MAFLSEQGHDLIRKYKATYDVQIRNEIVIFYSPVVKYIASSMRNIYGRFAEYDDMVNEGFIMLMSAIEQFDFDKKVRFETYASIKLRGSVIDYVRKHDWIPRSSRQIAKTIDEQFATLNSTLGYNPSVEELAKELDITTEKMLGALSDVNSSFTLSFEQLLYENEFDIVDENNDGITQAEKQIYLEELKGIMAQVIDKFTEKERVVVSLFYYEELKFVDIAKVLNVSTSRVSQLHSQALLKLRFAITKYQNGD